MDYVLKNGEWVLKAGGGALAYASATTFASVAAKESMKNMSSANRASTCYITIMMVLLLVLVAYFGKTLFSSDESNKSVAMSLFVVWLICIPVGTYFIRYFVTDFDDVQALYNMITERFNEVKIKMTAIQKALEGLIRITSNQLTISTLTFRYSNGLDNK
mgnify:CR=1 FL=1